jgi:hypothetical protein
MLSGAAAAQGLEPVVRRDGKIAKQGIASSLRSSQ